MAGVFAASPATVLVLQFNNDSSFPDLNWVGTSIAERLKLELGSSHQIVLSRDAMTEGFSRLGLRPSATYTKATLIKLGQSLDADFVCYGSFDVSTGPAPAGSAAETLKDSALQIAAHFLDLRKLRDGKDFSEAGKLTELSRMEAHMALQSLQYLEPEVPRTAEQFMTQQKFTKLEAEESYARGLLSTGDAQKQQWFRQASALDGRFSSPAYELGLLLAAKKDNRTAVNWLGRVPASDPRYADARFRMGLAAYQAGDFTTSANYFRDVLHMLPSNEVYNNLGAAENQAGAPTAVDDFKHAVEGDGNDPVYLFNLGAALLRANRFEEAVPMLQAALNRDADDEQARSLLERAQRREGTTPGAKPLAPDRLKLKLDETAFRQLKAMLH